MPVFRILLVLITLAISSASVGARQSGIQLKTLPVVITRWRDWREKHPETLVLDVETGFDRDYGLGKAYADYFASPKTR